MAKPGTTWFKAEINIFDTSKYVTMTEKKLDQTKCAEGCDPGHCVTGVKVKEGTITT